MPLDAVIFSTMRSIALGRTNWLSLKILPRVSSHIPAPQGYCMPHGVRPERALRFLLQVYHSPVPTIKLPKSGKAQRPSTNSETQIPPPAQANRPPMFQLRTRLADAKLRYNKSAGILNMKESAARHARWHSRIRNAPCTNP